MRSTLLLFPLLAACEPMPSTAPERDALPTLVKSGEDLPMLAGAIEAQGRLVQADGQLRIKLRDGSLIEVKAADPAPWEAVIERKLIATGIATPLRATAADDPVARLAVTGPPLLEPGNPDGFTKPSPDDFAGALPDGMSLVHAPLRGPIGPVRPVTLLLAAPGALEPLDAWAVGHHGAAHLPIEPRVALDTLRDVVPFDVDRDGQLEVVLLADWMTGVGAAGAVPQPRPVVLAWDGRALTQRTEYDEALAGVTSRRALARAFGASPDELPGADLMRVLALAEACARSAGSPGRGGSALRYGPGTVLVPHADTWVVTIPEQDAATVPHGARFEVDPAAGTCDGVPTTATTAGAPVDAADVLIVARECAEREHDRRGATGSMLLLDEPTITWRGPGKPWGVFYEERTPAGRPSGLDLNVGPGDACTGVPME